MTRLYLPATLDLLAAWHAEGRVPGDVEPVVAEDDSEEGEYAALMTAADLSREQAGTARRVVLVAEVAEPGRDVPLKRWVAVHVDDAEGADDDDDLGWYAVQEIPFLLN